MKKILFTAAVAALALSSCSKDLTNVGENVVENDVIGFSHYAMSNTKGDAILDHTEFESQTGFGQFEVKAFDATAGTSFTSAYLDANITYAAGKWGYASESDMRYWPENALNFFAYAPVSVAAPTMTYDGGMVFSGYKVTDVIAEQVDLMYASSLNATKTASLDADKNLPLNFNHALSQVHFAGKSINESLKVEITSVKLHNVNSVGTFAVKPTSSTLVVSAQGTPLDYSPVSAAAGAIELNATTYSALTSATDVMMLVPQTLTPWATATETTTATTGSFIEIVCKAYVEDPATGAIIYLIGTETATKSAYAPISGTWESGMSYTYNVEFSGGYDPEGELNLVEINFTTTSTNWMPDTVNM